MPAKLLIGNTITCLLSLQLQDRGLVADVASYRAAGSGENDPQSVILRWLLEDFRELKYLRRV